MGYSLGYFIFSVFHCPTPNSNSLFCAIALNHTQTLIYRGHMCICLYVDVYIVWMISSHSFTFPLNHFTHNRQNNPTHVCVILASFPVRMCTRHRICKVSLTLPCWIYDYLEIEAQYSAPSEYAHCHSCMSIIKRRTWDVQPEPDSYFTKF